MKVQGLRHTQVRRWAVDMYWAGDKLILHKGRRLQRGKKKRLLPESLLVVDKQNQPVGTGEGRDQQQHTLFR